MKRSMLIAVLIALLAPVAAFAGSSALRDTQLNRQLAAVRAATAKYHNVETALADGYIPVSPCEELPGQGAMGFHYLNPGLAQDLASTPDQPEVLLYVPDKNGKLKLAGVEYFQAAAGRTATQAPEILGVKFDGPMPGHNPEMPEHFDLHLWLWERNPSGLFAAWNPALSCGGAGEAHAH
jgi:hypothetical protein